MLKTLIDSFRNKRELRQDILESLTNQFLKEVVSPALGKQIPAPAIKYLNDSFTDSGYSSRSSDTYVTTIDRKIELNKKKLDKVAGEFGIDSFLYLAVSFGHELCHYVQDITMQSGYNREAGLDVPSSLSLEEIGQEKNLEIEYTAIYFSSLFINFLIQKKMLSRRDVFKQVDIIISHVTKKDIIPRKRIINSDESYPDPLNEWNLFREGLKRNKLQEEIKLLLRTKD